MWHCVERHSANSNMWAVLLLACVACAVAQVPSPCPGPKQFTGRFRRWDRERKFFIEGKMYYDEENQRIREFEDEDINGQREVYDKLKLYQLNLEYTVDLKTRNCSTSTPRPSSWFPYGVPPDARFRGEGTIGAVGMADESVTIAMFDGVFEGRDPYFVTVTQPDCFLVEIEAFRNGSFEEREGREFYDVVSGITDPQAFIPPRDCV